VFPIFSVGVSTGTVPTMLRRREVYRITKPSKGDYAKVIPVAGNTPAFNCTDQGLEEDLDAKDMEILGGEEIAVQSTALGLTEDVLRARDADLASVLFTTGTFGSGYNTAAAAAWDNASGKPIDDVAAAADKVRIGCGMMGNKAIISAGLYAKLRKNAQVQSQIRAILGYTDKQGGIANLVSEANLALAFGLEEVIIAGAIKDTADEGQTRSKGSVWADTFCLVFHQPPLGLRNAPYLGRLFAYDAGLSISTADVRVTDALRGLQVETYDSAKGNVRTVRVRQFLDRLLLNKDSGHLITGC
jgi:hypothetical protein